MATEREQPDRPLEAIILAGGQGTRMGGDRAKVLYEVADRPMVEWVVEACEAADCRRQVVVVGYDGDSVRARLSDRSEVAFVEQPEQLGTGHAVMQAGPLYKGVEPGELDVLVLCGDGPLIRPETIRQLVRTHRQAGAAATLATAELEDPTGYGRIDRDADGRFRGIVEHKEADERQRAIREINPSYYCFDAAALFEALGRIDNDNAKGEYLLTDVLGIMIGDGRRVELIPAVPAEDVLSINTPEQRAEVDRILRRRIGQEMAP